MIETGQLHVYGTMGVLSVGHGDTKLVFDKNNPAERIRAARIVTDMLRRGYALLVEVERNGTKAFERATSFREDTCEYIIADFDPLVAARVDSEEADEPIAAAAETSGTPGNEEAPSQPAQRSARGRRPRLKALDASTTRAVAVARSAGG